MERLKLTEHTSKMRLVAGGGKKEKTMKRGKTDWRSGNDATGSQRVK